MVVEAAESELFLCVHNLDGSIFISNGHGGCIWSQAESCKIGSEVDFLDNLRFGSVVDAKSSSVSVEEELVGIAIRGDTGGGGRKSGECAVFVSFPEALLVRKFVPGLR
jgi:hypothetical protein